MWFAKSNVNTDEFMIKQKLFGHRQCRSRGPDHNAQHEAVESHLCMA